MTSVVRSGASARVTNATVRPGIPRRARLVPPRARVRAHASARLTSVVAASAPLGLGSPAVRLASPLRRARGGSLVAGGAEKSGSAETSAAAKGDDVDALAERLDKLKEKSQAMLAEAEALERSVIATDEAVTETAVGGASAGDAETAATPELTSETTVKKLEPGLPDAAAKKAADKDPDVTAIESAGAGASFVESTRVMAGVVAGASLLAVGGSYAAGATSLLATEPVLALFGSAAAFAAVSVIDAVTPALKKREAAAAAAAKAAKAANPPARKPTAARKKPAKDVGEDKKDAEKKSATPAPATPAPATPVPAMPAPVNKPVDASAAKRAAAKAAAEDLGNLGDVGDADVGSVIKKRETPSSPASASMRAATQDPTKSDTQWLAPADAARMSGAALSPGADGAAESLVKRDTASRVSSPFASSVAAHGAGGASVSGSADESKLEELRAIATQRMAKRKMYEEYVKARPAAAGGNNRNASGDETASPPRDDATAAKVAPLARFLKWLFFPFLLPFAVVKFALRLIRNLLGGGKAAGAQ